MKKIILLILITFTTQITFAQKTTESIISTYLEKIGGVEKLKALENIKSEGTMAVSGMELPVIVLKGKDQLKIVMSYQGQDITQMSINGESHWKTNMQTMQVEDMADTEYEMIKTQINEFPDALLVLDELEYTATLKEKEEEIEGVTYDVITIGKPKVEFNGNSLNQDVDYYFNQETGLVDLIKAEPSVGQESEQIISDYIEVDGILIPHNLITKINGNQVVDILLTEVMTNAELTDADFAKPE